ncbi:gfo/Idh/MocA family oxidoreductase [Mycetocola tolaasinivorans]|uniref:Gfo/Idh/MocA family oxidoreductase n=1 Tax=Mycetocola tolaasinivorans TaxID=76635 RepID=A0A3L7A7I1_9MICO|nr:Gfo/Idh/MocA family oxidoreductase [Mycetocola tolaasinivorans]RLP75302.1 gfo/Idh/MocA family oxidoreductase [Mycetocola tolaasinivorans]
MSVNPNRIGAGVGVGIVGGGFMATVHARAARTAGATLVGVVASTPARSAQVAEELGALQAFDSLEALLADERITVVHVCTPNALHAEQAAAVIAAGKHVVCEKPLATTPAEARSITEAATAAGVVATVPFVYRFHPMAREARAQIAAGGKVLTIGGEYLQDWLAATDSDNWRVDSAQGGNSRAFADIGSHLVDLIEFIGGDRIHSLYARTRTFLAERSGTGTVTTEDAVSVSFETVGGAIGTLLVSQVAPGFKNGLVLKISATDSSIMFEQEQPDSLWLGTLAENRVLPREADRLDADAARLCVVPSGHAQGYQDAFNGFVADTYAAIAGETPVGLPTFADGLRAGLITQAVLDSAASGQTVVLD